MRCAPGWQCGQVIESEAGAPGVEGACFICRRRTDATSRSASSGMASRSPRSRDRAWSPSGPSSARATTRTLASATITVVADRSHGVPERDRPAGPAAGAVEDLLQGRLVCVLDQPARRYSWRDWCAAAARWRRIACVRSGTSLSCMLVMAPRGASSAKVQTYMALGAAHLRSSLTHPHRVPTRPAGPGHHRATQRHAPSATETDRVVDRSRPCPGTPRPTAIRGTRSDLLLRLTNRSSPGSMEVFGRREPLDSWKQLRR